MWAPPTPTCKQSVTDMATLQDLLNELDRKTKSGDIKWEAFDRTHSDDGVETVTSFKASYGKCGFLLLADGLHLTINPFPVQVLRDAEGTRWTLFDHLACVHEFPKTVPTLDDAMDQAMQRLKNQSD